MSYLARLRSLEATNRGTPAPDKADKSPSVSSVGASGTRFSGRDRASVDCEEQPQGLLAYPCPEGFAPERWEPLRQGAGRFANEWADKALWLGWTYEELFAIAEPFARVDLQGAAWFIGNASVTAVTADTPACRGTSPLSRANIPARARSRRKQIRRAQLRPWRRRHYIELGLRA
jgi:hypothetical protein